MGMLKFVGVIVFNSWKGLMSAIVLNKWEYLKDLYLKKLVLLFSNNTIVNVCKKLKTVLFPY